MKPIVVGIRIKNKFEILPLCLLSLAFQTYKDFDIYIYDESNVPITEYYPIRLTIDLLQLHYHIDVFHRRRIESKNVAQALINLLEYAKTNNYHYFLMFDADMVMMPSCLNKLYNHIDDSKYTIFTEPTVIDVNNSLNHKDYTLNTFGAMDVKKFGQWTVNHINFICDSSFTVKRKVTTASIPLIDMHKISKERYQRIIDKLNKLENLPGEDIVLYQTLTSDKYYGLLVSSAKAYHFSHTDQHRDWYNVTRQLQQMISKGKLP